MLDAHRQAHHAFAHTRLGQFFWVELAVCGGRRVRGQGLGIADVHQTGEQLQCVEEARARGARVGIAALEAETPAIAICTDGSDISIEGYTPSTLSVSEFAVSLRGQTLDCIIVLTNALISDGDKTSLLATLQSNNGVLLIISHD